MTAETVPAGHGVHAADPCLSLYLPTPHAAQPVLLTPVYPGRHSHCDASYDPAATVDDWVGHVMAELPPTQYCTPLHCWHADDPCVSAAYPRTQLQDPALEDCTGDAVFSGHCCAKTAPPGQ